MKLQRDHIASVRRVLGLHQRPLTRGEIYERARIDHIHQLDAALAHLAQVDQVVMIGTPTRYQRVPRAAA